MRVGINYSVRGILPPELCGTLRYAFVAVCMLIGGCGSADEVTTTSPYNKEQVRDLEIRAAANDPVALRELELHYDFEMDEAAREKIHQCRLSLGDPEALGEEVVRLVMSADKLRDCASKKTQLSAAMKIAADVAVVYKVKDIENDSDVKLVRRELAKLEC